MIVQDAEVIPSSLVQILKNPIQRQRILKIIIQTLYNLGFEQSAVQLQAESKIIYFTPQIRALKQALPLENYQQVEKMLENSPKFPQVRQVLNQLKCLKLIKEGKIQQALLIIQNDIIQEKKKEELSIQLMMDTQSIKPEIIKKKHDFIIQMFFDDEIAPNSMLKMINCYIQLQRKGLTTGISPQFSLLKKPMSFRGPPNRLIQKYSSLHIKSISFIRFNRSCTKILVVSSHKKQKYISIWSLNKQKQTISQLINSTFSVDEQIINVSWSYGESEMIAIATNNHVCVFSSDFKTKNKFKIGNGLHHSNKILCINWNQLTNFLYIGGSFQNVKVYGSTLEQIITIQPFIRTRSIYFNAQGTHMYAVSATKGLFIYYNLFQNLQEAQFVTQDIITSFRLQNKGKNIVLVTEKKILYLLVQPLRKNKFQILHSFENIFSENGLVQIEACLYYPWIVCLGEKEFQAFALEKQISKQEKWGSKNSFTFDITDGYMVSGEKQLLLWGSKLFQSEGISQNQSQMQIQEINRNMPIILDDQSMQNPSQVEINRESEEQNAQDDQQEEI